MRNDAPAQAADHKPRFYIHEPAAASAAG